MFDYTTGHIGRFWGEEGFKDLTYVKKPIKQSQVDEWIEAGYGDVKSFNGSMYDNSNPMPEWALRFDTYFPNIKNKTYTIYKMETLEIMPPHVDHFDYYMSSNNIDDKDQVCRIIVMLEDWKPGHYLEINGRAFTNWVAGDWFQWTGNCPHAAGNIGIQPRYTLQITGEKINESVLQDLHWYNFTDIPTKDVTLKHPVLNRALTQKIPEAETDPIFLYMHNGKISQLDTIRHPKPIIKYLNTLGLHFYLYEPLCSYATNFGYNKVNKNYHNTGFYSEFMETDLYENTDKLRADELDSIWRYAWNNDLTNITVHTCDYNVEKYYQYYAPKMHLICDDLFLKLQEPIYKLDTEISFDFKKKFICLNWRYTKHRHLTAAFASTTNSWTSFYFRGDFGNITNGSWIKYSKWMQDEPEIFDRLLKGISNINQGLPFKVDIESKLSSTAVLNTNSCMWPQGSKYHINETPAKDNTWTNNLQPFYQDVFCDIVTETRFAQPTGNYSEKLYQAMQYKKPFILCAPPKTLEYAKKNGFETFSDFWDESYDDCLDHTERMAKIFKLIAWIDSKPMSELRDMYREMLPIIEHNYSMVHKMVK
jgi:hypothetical protein